MSVRSTIAIVEFLNVRFEVGMFTMEEINERGAEPIYVERDARGKLTGRASALVEKRNPLDHTEMSLMGLLADKADDDGNVYKVSQAGMMRYLDRSESNVKVYLNRLIWRGQLQRQINGSAKNRYNLFILTPGRRPISDYFVGDSLIIKPEMIKYSNLMRE